MERIHFGARCEGRNSSANLELSGEPKKRVFVQFSLATRGWKVLGLLLKMKMFQHVHTSLIISAPRAEQIFNQNFEVSAFVL